MIVQLWSRLYILPNSAETLEDEEESEQICSFHSAREIQCPKKEWRWLIKGKIRLDWWEEKSAKRNKMACVTLTLTWTMLWECELVNVIFISMFCQSLTMLWESKFVIKFCHCSFYFLFHALSVSQAEFSCVRVIGREKGQQLVLQKHQTPHTSSIFLS